MQAVDGVIFHPLFISVLNLMDTLLRTSLLTLSAAYTFRMIWIFRRVYLHLADFRTGAAAHTFFSVYPVAEHRNRVKHGVNSSKRAYVFAEWPINQNRQENCKKKQHVFPGIQPSQGAVHGFIQQMPPSSVPTGQISLQKYGAPCPKTSTRNIGSRITKNSSTTYLSLRKSLSPLNVRSFLGKGILYNKS